MLMYFIVFSVIGFIIGISTKSIQKAMPAIIFISVVWGISTAPIWGLATLGELSLGFFIYTMTSSRKEINNV